MPKAKASDNPEFRRAMQESVDKAADQASLYEHGDVESTMPGTDTLEPGYNGLADAGGPHKEAHDQPALSADRIDTFTSRDDDLGWTTLEDTDETVNACYFGREGSWKTTCVAAMANLGPILFINAEGGLKKAPLKRLGIRTENIRVWPRRDRGEVVNYEDMERWAFKLAADLADDPKSWAGAVWDSGSEVVEALLEQMVTREMKRAARANKPRADRWQVERGDYGKMSSQVRSLLRKFRDLPCHFAVTALERRDVDEDSGRVAYGPAVNPGLQKDLLGIPDLVLYCKADLPIGYDAAVMRGDRPAVPEDDEPTEGRALTRPKGRFRAKDRIGELPPVLVNPRFDKVVRYVNGDLTEEDDPDQAGVLAAREEAAARANGDNGGNGASGGAELTNESNEHESE